LCDLYHLFITVLFRNNWSSLDRCITDVCVMSSRFDGICRVSTESMEALHGVRYKSYGGHTMLMVKVTSKMLRWGKLYIFCLIRCITDCTTLPLHPHGWITLTLGAFCVAIQLHTLMYNWTRIMQLANTPPLQSTTPGIHP